MVNSDRLKIKDKITPAQVEDFIKECSESINYFRYFEQRSFDVINNHIITVLLYDINEPVGYGHLEKENGKIWLGIVISDGKKGKGYGKYLMEYLVKFNYNTYREPIYLTVDIKNRVAINLFEENGFNIDSKLNNRSFLMKNID